MNKLEELQNQAKEFARNGDYEGFKSLIPELEKLETEKLNEPEAPETRLLRSIFGGGRLPEKPQIKREKRKWNRQRRVIKRMQGDHSNQTFILNDGFHILRDVHPRAIILRPGTILRLEGLSHVDAILVDHDCTLELDRRFITQRPHVNGIMAANDAKVKYAFDQVNDHFDLDKIRKDPNNYSAMKRIIFRRDHNLDIDRYLVRNHYMSRRNKNVNS